jgi:hypothetical protein
MSRDWERLAKAKRLRWDTRRRKFGPAEGLRVAAELYEHVRLTRPDWPAAASRLEDLQHHIKLSEQLRAYVSHPAAR